MKHTRRVILGLAFVLPLVVALTGCAGLSTKSPPEDTLRERVSAYMQARVDERWSDAYDFFAKGLKESISREEFVAAPTGIDLVAHQIESITVDDSEKEAEVVVKVDINVRGFDFKGLPQKQRWIKQGRNWYITEAREAKTPFD